MELSAVPCGVSVDSLNETPVEAIYISASKIFDEDITPMRDVEIGKTLGKGDTIGCEE